MTVAELIAKLQEMPGDMPVVWVCGETGSHHAAYVEVAGSDVGDLLAVQPWPPHHSPSPSQVS